MRSYQFPYLSNSDDYLYPYYAYATRSSNACVGGTTRLEQCDGKSTVFYNGCCRRRNSACGNGGYLAQRAGNHRNGECIVPEARAKKNFCQGLSQIGRGLHECSPEEAYGDVGKGLPIGGKESLIDKAIETYASGGGGGGTPGFGGFPNLGGLLGGLGGQGGCLGIGLPNLVPMIGDTGCYIIPAAIGIILLLVFMRMR